MKLFSGKLRHVGKYRKEEKEKGFLPGARHETLEGKVRLLGKQNTLQAMLAHLNYKPKTKDRYKNFGKKYHTCQLDCWRHFCKPFSRYDVPLGRVYTRFIKGPVFSAKTERLALTRPKIGARKFAHVDVL